MSTPWDATLAAVRRLAERVDALPTFREATQYDATRVVFDTDTVPTIIRGTLANGVPAGARVLTMTLRHYVWVLGVKNGASPYQPPAEPYLLAMRSTTASIPNNTWTPINLGVSDVVKQVYGMDLSNNTITIQKSGIYTIFGAVKFAGATGGNSRGLGFYISSVTPGNQVAESNNRANGYINATIPVATAWTGPLNAGDTVQMVAVQNSGAAVNLTAIECGLAYIGPKP